MNRKCIPRFVLAMSVLAVAVPVRAEVFERDWKTPGDGLLTYDDVNQREWLDLTAQLTIPTPRYDSVIAELGPGGIFEGFAVAKQNDVIAFAESAGIETVTVDFAVNGDSTLQLIDLLTGRNGGIIRGQVQETFPFGPDLAQVGAEIFYLTGGAESAGVRFLSFRTDAFPNSDLPVYIYRPVPEPKAIHLAVLLLMLVGIQRFRSNPSISLLGA